MTVRNAVGRYGEQVAARHLEQAGLIVLERNWRFSGHGFRGELDILAQDGSTLVAVEVKTRRSRACGWGAEAVTRDKLRRIRRLLGAWLSQHPDVHPAQLRIDVMDVLVTGHGAAEVTHLKAVS